MVADLLAQCAPFIRAHALTLLAILLVALLVALLVTCGTAALLIALDLLAALLLALGPALFNIAAPALATLRSLATLAPLTTGPAMAWLCPHHLCGGEQTETKNKGRAFHDDRLTAWRNRS